MPGRRKRLIRVQPLLKLRRLLRPFSRFILLRRNRRRKRRHGAARTGYPDQPIARLHEGHRERRGAPHIATPGSRTSRHSLPHPPTTPTPHPTHSHPDRTTITTNEPQPPTT